MATTSHRDTAQAARELLRELETRARMLECRLALSDPADPADRAVAASEVAQLRERMAELRPCARGRRRDITADQSRFASAAREAAQLARAETARATALDRGVTLPDPAALHRGEVDFEAVAGLYERAAEGALTTVVEVQPC